MGVALGSRAHIACRISSPRVGRSAHGLGVSYETVVGFPPPG
jgi:hypothetical protein